MKPAVQKALFWEEISLMQQRHAPFFPDDQLQYIKLRSTKNGLKLVILPDHQLASQTIMEIEFAFKITQPRRQV